MLPGPLSGSALVRWLASVKLQEHGMVTFSVKDMRVSSQAEAALEAVKHVDGNALVSISLHANEVQIAQESAGAIELSDAIAHAAFNPELKRCGQQSPSRVTASQLDEQAMKKTSGSVRRVRGCHVIFVGLMSLLAAAAVPCHAAPEEIQVYLDDLSKPGNFGLDVHNNYVLSGTDAPSYPGELPPRHVYRLTPEFYYGLTKTMELGLYVLTTKGPEGSAHLDGGKVRLKYIAPHDSEAGMFWGMNLEVGRTSLRVSELPWNAQLKGILGYRAGAWTVALNPNLDVSLAAHGGPVLASLDGKVSYAIAKETKLGFEAYNELGPLSHLQSLSRNSKTLYAVVDQNFAGFDLNAGVGRGLTHEADRWVMKFIVGKHF